jgi:hypothetical protein
MGKHFVIGEHLSNNRLPNGMGALMAVWFNLVPLFGVGQFQQCNNIVPFTDREIFGGVIESASRLHLSRWAVTTGKASSGLGVISGLPSLS